MCVIDASAALGQRLIRIIELEDAEALHRLVVEDYPNVVWGNYFQLLTPDQRKWAFQHLPF